MKSKVNVVILAPGFAENESDDTCIPSLQALIRSIQKQYSDQFNLHVISFQYPFIEGLYNWNGVPCYSAGGRNSFFLARVLAWNRVRKKVLEIHSNEPVPIIHSFWLTECAAIGSWLSKKIGAKHIAHAMGQDVRSGNRYLKFTGRPKGLIIANSDFSSKELNKNYGYTADHVIPFGVDENDFMNLDFSSPREIDILGVGSLTTVKNFKVFVALFREMKKIFSNLYGEIIGEGPLEDELLLRINAEGLQDSLVLKGKLSRSEVLKKMTHSKILLHTSVYESAGYVFLEALRCGMKVVSFETGFLPDVKGAYPSKNAEEMKRNLASLLTYRQEYQQVKVPVIDDTAKKVSEVYRELLK